MARTNQKQEKNLQEKKINALLGKLTLDEKLKMIHGAEFFRSGGVPRLGIPGITMSDGPMGVRNDFRPAEWVTIGSSADQVGYFPSNSAIAATWNTELAHDAGKALGEEARGRGKDMILAPGINIKRNPLCGRNFEYLSEDPYLVSEMAVSIIEGIQETDVSACVKHFACNSQEEERFWVNVDLDERTFREIYLPGFEAAVKRAKTKALMGSYNLVRGEHGSQSKKLLNDILRDEWKYDGVVVSDWGAIHDTEAAAMSGLDIEMSVTPDFDEYFCGNPLKKKIEAGEIPEEVVDAKIRNILRFMLRVRMIEIELTKTAKGGESVRVAEVSDRERGEYGSIRHQQMALDVAREAVVLLKNDKKRLPLKPEKTRKLLVIGDNANRAHANGGGSAEIKAIYEITPLLGLAKEYGGNTEIRYVKGYYVPRKKTEEVNWQEGSINIENLNEFDVRDKRKYSAQEKKLKKELRDEAVRLAAEYDDVIIVGGYDHDYDVEGKDRIDMKLPYDQDVLIRSVLEVNPKAVVVMVAGSPVDMTGWKDKAAAILWMSYNGMEGGTALAEVISGKVNPSGKLPESLPMNYEQSPAAVYGDYPGRKITAAEKKKINAHLMQTFREGIFVGYRYYEKQNVKIQYPFGHGLSYTEFAYSKLTVEKTKTGKVQVSVTVKNTGGTDGKETVQLYVGEKKVSEENAVKELKGFKKLALKKGQQKVVRFVLEDKDFSHYSEAEKGFVMMHGDMVIYVGSSSADIRCKGTVNV